MDGQAGNEIERPRSAPQVLGATFGLYGRFPLLFLVLAAAVIVPYELIVLAATGAGPLAQGHVKFGASMLLLAISSFLISPLVSALHVHAVDDVRGGRKPVLESVARRGVITLPVVAAAAIVSSLGIFLGFIALLVPGVLLSLRWSVVAQAAAIEDKGWTEALGRSTDLSRAHYWHILWLLIVTWVLGAAPNLLLGLAYGHKVTTIGSFVAGTALEVVVRSFTALVFALLYFDLSARWAAEPIRPVLMSGKHGFDPDGHADEDRSPGWYIDPDHPKQMRYWAANGEPGWSERTVKTPKNVRTEWVARRNGERLPEPTKSATSAVQPTGHPLDPDSYSDEERPPGWYVEPAEPWRMRYWDPEDGWGKRTTKTPRKTQDGWYKAEGR